MVKVDYLEILRKYIGPESELYRIILIHSTLVTNKALKIARELNLSKESIQFIEEAGMLHDIGIIKTNAPEIFCFGKSRYITHGTEGAKILKSEGLEAHAEVAQRHTGVGLTIDDIEEQDLPLPKMNLEPRSIEEKVLCYTDTFFSKITNDLWIERSVNEARKTIEKFGQRKIDIFNGWVDMFE
jgi:uncharacterized protein